MHNGGIENLCKEVGNQSDSHLNEFSKYFVLQAVEPMSCCAHLHYFHYFCFRTF